MKNKGKIKIDPSAFVARNATVIGSVTIGKDASVWFGAVVRGDMAEIIIGDESNVQDNAVVHVDFGKPSLIGNGVTVGHGAIIHGAVVKDNVLIGMGSILLNGAVIGENSVIGAGTVVTEGFEVPPNSLVIGVPGKIIRQLKQEEIERIKDAARVYVEYAREYKGAGKF
ncbi:MAG: gamma carbonic anhydrase family protein [Nitrospirae bacterium]|nr:gamma carbonic anhydrase family protein [Nitrospirota bacterium]